MRRRESTKKRSAAKTLAEAFLMRKWRSNLTALYYEEFYFRHPGNRKPDPLLDKVYPSKKRQSDAALNKLVDQMVGLKFDIYKLWKRGDNQPKKKAFYLLDLFVKTLSDHLKHFALKDDLIFTWLNALQALARHKELDLKFRKVAKQKLEEFFRRITPNLRQEKSSLYFFNEKLLIEFESVRESFRKRMKRTYRNDAAKDMDIKDVVDSLGIRDLNPHTMLYADNNQRTYRVLGLKNHCSPALIVKNVKRLKKEQKRIAIFSRDFEKRLTRLKIPFNVVPSN